jgi:hypothetical protein
MARSKKILGMSQSTALLVGAVAVGFFLWRQGTFAGMGGGGTIAPPAGNGTATPSWYGRRLQMANP